MRDIEIVQFGKTFEGKPTFFVKCGCETFVFVSKEDVKTFVNVYMDDPDGTERAYYRQFENEKMAEPSVMGTATLRSEPMPETSRNYGGEAVQASPDGNSSLGQVLRGR